MSLKVEKEIALAEKEMDILQYLPPVVGNIRECKAVAVTENPQLQRLWKALDAGLKDQFVLDSTIHGVKRMEGILGIAPKGTESQETRKRRILARMNETLPYTYKRLEGWLMGVCKEDNFSLELSAQIYQLTLKLAYLSNDFQWEVFSIARRMIPANLFLRQLVIYETPEPAFVGVGSCHGVAARLTVNPMLIGEYRDCTVCHVGTCHKISTRLTIEPYHAGAYYAENSMAAGAVLALGIHAVVSPRKEEVL